MGSGGISFVWALVLIGSCYADETCDPNCDLSSGCQSSGQGKCDTRCNDGYVLVNNVCYACGRHCTSGCDEAGPYKCDTTCKPGYAVSPAGICQTCDVNCDTAGCTEPFTCSGKCKDGFAKDDESKCLPCQDKCAGTCSQPFRCDPGQCKKGTTYDSKSQTCISCSPNCDPEVGCDNAGPNRCDKCKPNFYRCPKDDACFPCDKHCDPRYGCQTAGRNLCDRKCIPGYELDVRHRCQPIFFEDEL